MKKFFEDYKNLVKQSGRFYKEHWFGTAMITAVGLGLSLAPAVIQIIKTNREIKEIENRELEELEKIYNENTNP